MLQAERLTLKILKFDTKNTSAFYLKSILFITQFMILRLLAVTNYIASFLEDESSFVK